MLNKSKRTWIGKNAAGFQAVLLIMATPAYASAQSASAGLLGDLGGVRPALERYGASLDVTDSENLLGNLSGGIKQGATMQGVTNVTLQVDLGKMFNWQGGSFNVSALQIHGRSLSPYYLADLQTANGNEADDSTRLWELWYDQSFYEQRADLKIGQQSIDNEFMVSTYSGLFVNTMAGWPLVPSADLYAGGPAYPLSSLGVRLRVKPADNQTILAGVFDDNPPGGRFNNDPQSKDAGGVRFNTGTGALLIAEYQFSNNQPATGDMVQPGQLSGLPGVYKIGFWYDTGRFDDQAFNDHGLSLASPASDGVAGLHRGNYSIYAVMDQTIARLSSARMINLFARLMMAPDNRNLISMSFNGGLTLTAPFAGRENDSAGLDIGVAKVSERARTLDRDSALYGQGHTPIRNIETLVELTYQYQLTPSIMVQPDLQYIFSPGGSIDNPSKNSAILHNELVAGMRINMSF